MYYTMHNTPAAPSILSTLPADQAVTLNRHIAWSLLKLAALLVVASVVAGVAIGLPPIGAAVFALVGIVMLAVLAADGLTG